MPPLTTKKISREAFLLSDVRNYHYARPVKPPEFRLVHAGPDRTNLFALHVSEKPTTGPIKDIGILRVIIDAVEDVPTTLEIKYEVSLAALARTRGQITSGFFKGISFIPNPQDEVYSKVVAVLRAHPLHTGTLD